MTNKFHDEQALIPQVTGYQLPEPELPEVKFYSYPYNQMKMVETYGNAREAWSRAQALRAIRHDVLKAGLDNGGIDTVEDVYPEIAGQVRESAYQAGRESMREECLKECNDLHHQWRFGEDSTSGPLDCADAIKGIK